jgi:hypothetical protein
MSILQRIPRTLPYYSIVFWLIFWSIGLHAQGVQRAVIQGTVVDDSTGTPIPLVNVFVVSSKIGSATDRQGKFKLTNVPLGALEIVASIVGYDPAIRSVRLSDSTLVKVDFRLKPRAVQMPGVEVVEKDPEEWRKHLKKFSEAFFGTTRNASSCKILNPEVLDFAGDPETNELKVTAREPLKVENKALGYRFQCVFMYSVVTSNTFEFSASAGFEALKPTDADEETKWEAGRREAYYGSKRHFLQSLIRKQSRLEGFSANLLGSSWHQEALRRPTGMEVDPETLVFDSDFSFEKKISFIGFLQVIYSRGGVRRISLLELGGPIATIYTNGLNPLGIWTHGYWSMQRTAEMLPTDYEPE